MRLAIGGVLLTLQRHVFDCSLTGETGKCLRMRYGWDPEDAARAATDVWIQDMNERAKERQLQEQ